MFCPKCGTQSVTEDQRFCKFCGTNLQAVSDAIDKNDSKSAVKDPVAFGLGIVSDIVETVKESVGDVTINKDSHRAAHIADKRARRQAKIEEWKAKHEAHVGVHVPKHPYKRQQRQTPNPKTLLSYSSEHNLKYGLMSLLGGLGFGLFLFYFCRAALDAGVIQDIEAQTHQHINVLEPLIRWLWLLSAGPVLKGLGRIFYAAFFAESIKTLAKRFTRETEPVEEESKPRVTAPQANTSPFQESLPEPPSSVTEGTTRLMEEAKATKSS